MPMMDSNDNRVFEIVRNTPDDHEIHDDQWIVWGYIYQTIHSGQQIEAVVDDEHFAFMIDEIYTYGHIIDEIDRGMSARLALSGPTSSELKQVKYLYRVSEQ